MNARVSPVVPRLERARQRMRAAAIDALVVSHLPNLRYLTGFVGTAGLVVLTPARCVLVVDFRYQAVARSLVTSTPELRVQRLARRAGDELRRDARRGPAGEWRATDRDRGRLDARQPLQPPVVGARCVRPTPLRSPDGCPALVATERIIEAERVVKDEAEIAALTEAGRRLGGAARRPSVWPGRVDRSSRSPPISMRCCAGRVSSARRSRPSSPQGQIAPCRTRGRGRGCLREGDGVVLDFGGVYDGYCVDLTRTVQLGDAGAEFRRLFAAVADAQQQAIASVRPGVKASTVDDAARAALGRYGLEEAFGHGTGHGLGLEVHEEPRIGRPLAGQPDLVLQPGMVFTVEPGVYVDGVGGVRIEDDVLVTDDGCLVLTANGG